MQPSLHLEPSSEQRGSLARSGALTDLVEEILCSRQASLQIRVTGKSMYPTIQNNDIVVIAPCSNEQFQPGDILLLKDLSGGLLLHRLLYDFRTTTGNLQTKGDNHPVVDIPLPASNVLGRLTTLQRPGKKRRSWNYASPHWRLFNRLYCYGARCIIAARRLRRCLFPKSFYN